MLRCGASLFLVLLVSVTQPAAVAQKREESLRIGVNVVTLDIAVTDKRRRPVSNLTAKDFTVLEDGVPQRIESFTTGSAVPARVGEKVQSDQGVTSAEKSSGGSHAPNQAFSGYKFIS